MPRHQSFLKFLILCYMPFGVVAGIGAYAGTFWYLFSGEKYLAAADAPSGHFRALIVRVRDNHDCGASGGTFVVIERKIGFLKTGELSVFCAADEAADGLGVQWSGPSELSINCPRCTEGEFHFYNGRWGEFTFRLEH